MRIRALLLAAFVLTPLSAGAVNPASWDIVDLTTTGQDVFWSSPTTVTTGLADYEWTYTIVKVEARATIIVPQWVDITDQLSGSGIPLMGGDTEPGLPFVLVDESLNESGNSADFLIQVDATGRGQASITNVVLGSFLGFDITGIRASLNFTVEGFPYGDYNHDRSVDMADYDLWYNTFDSTTDLSADGNRSGRVDAADYPLWRDHSGLSAGSAAGSLTVIPEPTGLALVSIPSIAMIFYRRFAK